MDIILADFNLLFLLLILGCLYKLIFSKFSYVVQIKVLEAHFHDLAEFFWPEL